MGIIKARDLKYEYFKYDDNGQTQESQTAVDSVNLDIREGQFISILGHNGSGKSTLAKHMNALLIPTEGTMWVDGKDTAAMEELWEIRQTAGMVFQNPDNQIIGTVVEEDVGFGPENLGVPTEDIWTRVEKSLEAVGMMAYRSHSPNKLSGGQKQRLTIARALVGFPEILILDDSASALDFATDAALRQSIAALSRESGNNMTVILVSQRANTVRYADKIIVLDDGRAVGIGTHEQLLADCEQYREIYWSQNEENEKGGQE